MQLIIMKQDVGLHKKGDIIEIRATSTPFGGSEPASFVMVEVPDKGMKDYLTYNCMWERLVDYEVVASDLTIDGFRIRIYSPVVNAAGLGKITKNEVETFITNWGGSVYSFGDNEVIFNIKILDALKSRNFWDIPNLENIVFTELSYTQATGVHRLQIDYSALVNNPSYVEQYILDRGGVIISHANRVLVAEFTRADVRAQFEADIRLKAKKMIARRRYYFTAAVVDYIIGQGGTISTTAATVAGYIKDKTS